MEYQDNLHKVAILVDGDSCISHSISGKIYGAKVVQTIKAASLKCLTRFAKGGAQIQWAYLVFSQNKSDALRRTIGRKFKEFNLDTYNDFEECLGSLNNEHVQGKHDDEYLNTGAKQIRISLADTVMNLPWLPPEIASPIKGQRMSGLDEFTRNTFKNHVFLFTFCPHDYADLRTFVSHDNKSANSESSRLEMVFEDIMPIKLQHRLRHSCRVQFNLTDLAPLIHEERKVHTGDGRAYGLIQKGIDSIDGNLYPVTHLINRGEAPPLLQNSNKETIVHSLSSHCSTTEAKFNDGQNIDRFKAVIVFSRDGSRDPFIFGVSVEPFVSDFISTLQTGNTFRTPSVTGVESVQVESADAKFSNTDLQIDIIASEHSLPEKATSLHILVIGTTLLRDVQPWMEEFCSNACFLTPCADVKIARFAKAMLGTLEKQVVHIVEVATNNNDIGFGLLQPLSFASAALYMLTPGIPQSHVTRLVRMATLNSVSCDRVDVLNALVDKSMEQDSAGEDRNITLKEESEVIKQVEAKEDSENYSQPMFTSSFLEDYYHPGAQPENAQAILADLNGEEDTETAVRNFELKLLRKLQKKYISKKSARLTDTPKAQKGRTPRRNASRSGLSQLRRSPRKKCSTSSTKDGPPVILPPRHPVRKSRSHTAPSRTDQLWQAYRTNLKRSDSTKTKQPEGDNKKPKQNEEQSTNTISCGDIENEQALLDFAQKFYDDILSGSGNDMVSAVQRLVNTCVHFFKSKKGAESPSAEKTCCEFFEQILMDNKAIKKKYQIPGQENALFREYELQVVLIMEIETIVNFEESEEESDAKVSKIAGMLRAMSFMRDSEFCGKYVKSVLLQNYVHNAAMFLAKIYDELLLPLPPQLETLMSPDELMSVATKSVNPLMSIGSNASSTNNSIRPPSNHTLRNSKLNRYRSFHAVSTRQIAVPKLAVAKKEAKKVASEQPRRVSARIASSVKKSAKKRAQSHNQQQDDSKKVRKNLFGAEGGAESKRPKPKLERRQSCMADIQKHTRKQSRTPRGHHVLKSRRVAETPAHKQKKQTVWRRHEKERRRTQTADAVEVIAESPGKHLVEDAAKRTPKKATGKLVKNKSFYSENVTRAEKLEARMINQKILSPTWNAPKFGTLLQKTPPRRIQPRMLFQSLLQSPSPQKLGLVGAEGLQSPVKSTETFSLGRAVSALNFSQSPCKSTRAQQASRKAFTNIDENKFERLFPSSSSSQDGISSLGVTKTPDKSATVSSLSSPAKPMRSQPYPIGAASHFQTMAGDRFERIFTPRGKQKIMNTPTKENAPNVCTAGPDSMKRTPVKTRLLDSNAFSPSLSSRRVSFCSQLLSPQKEMHKPCDPLQSPSKSILTPKKGTRTPSKLAFPNQLISPPPMIENATMSETLRKPKAALFQSPVKTTRSTPGKNVTTVSSSTTPGKNVNTVSSSISHAIGNSNLAPANATHMRRSPRRVAIISSSQIPSTNPPAMSTSTSNTSSPDTPVIAIASGLDSSSSASDSPSDLQPEPRITRSASKSQQPPLQCNVSSDRKARANLSSLFNDDKTMTGAFEAVSEEKGTHAREQRPKGFSDNKENDDSCMENGQSENPSIVRRTLRSKTRSSSQNERTKCPSKRLFSCVASQGNDSTYKEERADSDSSHKQTRPRRGVKRKETSDIESEPSLQSRKKSRGSLFSAATAEVSILSLPSLPDVSFSDVNNEVFMEDEDSCMVAGKTRTLEGITKSSLISTDNSNSAFSFSDIAETAGVSTLVASDDATVMMLRRSRSEPCGTIPQINRIMKSFDNYDSESSRSPEFGDVNRPKAIPLRLISRDDRTSDSSLPPSPVLQLSRVESPTFTDAISNGQEMAKTAVFTNIAQNNDESANAPPSISENTRARRPPSRASDASLTPGRVQSFSPHLKSPSNKFSPLSTKSLVQLTESPILSASGSNNRSSKAKCTTPKRNIVTEENDMALCKYASMDNTGQDSKTTTVVSPVNKRPARRSLYRAATKPRL